MGSCWAQCAEGEPLLFESDLVRALKRCIEVTIDAERVFAAGASDAADPALRGIFVVLAKERSDFVFALQSIVETLGAIPDDEGSAENLTLHVRGAPSDRALLMQATQAERLTKRAYMCVLEDASLADAGIAHVIRRQFDSIRHGEAELRRRLASL